MCPCNNWKRLGTVGTIAEVHARTLSYPLDGHCRPVEKKWAGLGAGLGVRASALVGLSVAVAVALGSNRLKRGEKSNGLRVQYVLYGW